MTKREILGGNIFGIAGYFVLFIVLFASSFYFRAISGEGNEHVYEFLRILRVPLVFALGIFSLIRHLSGGGGKFLFFATGFLGAFVLEVIHVFVISPLYYEGLGFYSQTFFDWSFSAPAYFTLIFLLAAWFFSEEEIDEKERMRGYAGGILASIFTFVFLTGFFYFFHPFPSIYYMDVIFGGVQELIISILALIVLTVYLIGESKRREVLFGWIISFLVIFSLSQIFFVSAAKNQYDLLFNIGHLLRIISYVALLFGFVLDSIYFFEIAEEGERRIKEKDGELKEMRENVREIREKYENKKSEMEKTLLEMERNKSELEKMNEMMVGREIKMIELKKELAELRNKVGEA